MRLHLHEQGSKYQQFNTNPSALKENSALAKRQLRMVHQIEQLADKKAAQALNQPAYKLDDSLKAMIRQIQAENAKEEMQADAGPMENALLEDGTDALDDREECPYVPSGEVELPFAGKPTEEIQDEAILEIISQLKRPDNYLEDKFTFEIDWEKMAAQERVKSALPNMPSGGSEMFGFIMNIGTGHLEVKVDYLDIIRLEIDTGNAFNILSEQYGQMRKYAEAIDGEKYGEGAKQALIKELDNHFTNIIGSIFNYSDKISRSMNQENFNSLQAVVDRFEELYGKINNGAGKNYDDQMKNKLLDKLKSTFKFWLEFEAERQYFTARGTDPAVDLKAYEKMIQKASGEARKRSAMIKGAMKSINWYSAETVLKTLGNVKSLYK